MEFLIGKGITRFPIRYWAIFFTFYFLLFSYSCQYLKLIGLRTPRVLSEEDAVYYLRKVGFTQYDYSFTLPRELKDTLSHPAHALDLYKLKRGVGESIIQLRIYNASGVLVNGYTQCYGPLHRLNILKEKDFVCLKHLPNNYWLLFSNELALMPCNDSLKRVISDVAKQKKYTFVVYWNRWSNFYSRDIFHHIKRYFRKFGNRSDVLVIMMNDDSFVSKGLFDDVKD